ncbi:putative threonine--tRNA ligase, cytoplasmic [Dictyocoela muelleri]|nr:putative threonine--tRNA ligase, cytoplasmic [Dictyocoela muelleri]
MTIKIRIENKEYSFPVKTKPLEISKQLKIHAIACKGNGKLMDLTVELTHDLHNQINDLKNCINNETIKKKSSMNENANEIFDLEFLDFEQAKNVFWHSSAHILGCAVTRLFKCRLLNGPPTESGFYYDIEHEPFTSDDIRLIESEMRKIVSQKIDFVKQYYSKAELLNLFKDNPHKMRYINKYVKERSSVYAIGDWIDFCEGPHVVNTSIVKSIKITHYGSIVKDLDDNEKNNNDKKSSFQRISGIAFPSQSLMDEYEKFIKHAKENDHRKLGLEHNLFFFNDLSPGSCFFLPKGAFIYNKLIEFLRILYRKNGFKEVITPNMYQTKLWETSGHLQNYRENMFMIEDFEIVNEIQNNDDSNNQTNVVDTSEKIQYALKPMNCPGHCLMFKSSERSFRDLPIRFADFGVLHRNELSGTLSGLTRVRRFQQDDAHIFCAFDQIEEEIQNCLKFLSEVYNVFNFSFKVFLSTRPKEFIGSLDDWERAEEKLKMALTKSNLKFEINEGDGAFYGPKIDIILKDAFKREIQCGTIQLDFQLPMRFELKFKSPIGYERPVIIHRAIFGSLERFIAILLESYGKRLPLWLSPNQIAVITIPPKKDIKLKNDNKDDQKLIIENKVADLSIIKNKIDPIDDNESLYEEYLYNLKQTLFNFEVSFLNDDLSVNKRVLKAEKAGFNYIIFVGMKEVMSGTVDVRGRGPVTLDNFIKEIEEKVKNWKE